MPLLHEIENFEATDHHAAVLSLKEKPQSQNITEAIFLLRDLWFNRYNLNPDEINTGACDQFALDVTRLVAGAWTMWQPDTSLPPHCFVVYEEHYFDSECPHGVEFWGDLPIFERERE